MALRIHAGGTWDRDDIGECLYFQRSLEELIEAAQLLSQRSASNEPLLTSR